MLRMEVFPSFRLFWVGTAAIFGTGNMMDSRVIFRMDMPFHIVVILWPLLKSFCRIHVFVPGERGVAEEQAPGRQEVGLVDEIAYLNKYQDYGPRFLQEL